MRSARAVAAEWHEEEFGEEQEERARDSKIDEAREGVLELLEENNGSVYYIKQLQVLLEAKFYHWVVGRAIGELINEQAVGHEDAPLENGKATFLFHRSHRYRKRQIDESGEADRKVLSARGRARVRNVGGESVSGCADAVRFWVRKCGGE